MIIAVYVKPITLKTEVEIVANRAKLPLFQHALYNLETAGALLQVP